MGSKKYEIAFSFFTQLLFTRFDQNSKPSSLEYFVIFENLVKMQLYIKSFECNFIKNLAPVCNTCAPKNKKYETTIAFTLPLMKIR